MISRKYLFRLSQIYKNNSLNAHNPKNPKKFKNLKKLQKKFKNLKNQKKTFFTSFISYYCNCTKIDCVHYGRVLCFK